jgi:hypothetical protein
MCRYPDDATNNAPTRVHLGLACRLREPEGIFMYPCSLN